MASLQSPPSINDARTQALLELAARLDTLDLTPLFVYSLDSTPDSALIFLAWQFDVLAAGWQLAAGFASTGDFDALTDIDTLTDIDNLSLPGSVNASDFDAWRTLLKESIPLHRVRGTPYSITQALASLGFSDVTFEEGQASWGGSVYPSSQGWAVFRVVVHLAAAQMVGPNDGVAIAAAVNFFKPERSWLDQVIFAAVPFSDAGPVPIDFPGYVESAPAPTDTITAMFNPLSDVYGPLNPLVNGHYLCSGGHNCGANEPVLSDDGIVANGVPIASTFHN